MTIRRIESDECAAQGFELKSEDAAKAHVASEPEAVRQEELLVPQTQTEQPGAVAPEVPADQLGTSGIDTSEASFAATSEPSEEEKDQPVQNEPEPLSGRIEPTLGIDLGYKALQGNGTTEKEGATEPSFKMTSDETLDQKLVQARSLLQSSLSNHAVELLEEIALKGNDEQRAAALKLLTEKQP